MPSLATLNWANKHSKYTLKVNKEPEGSEEPVRQKRGGNPPLFLAGRLLLLSGWWHSHFYWHLSHPAPSTAKAQKPDTVATDPRASPSLLQICFSKGFQANSGNNSAVSGHAEAIKGLIGCFIFTSLTQSNCHGQDQLLAKETVVRY